VNVTSAMDATAPVNPTAAKVLNRLRRFGATVSGTGRSDMCTPWGGSRWATGTVCRWMGRVPMFAYAWDEASTKSAGPTSTGGHRRLVPLCPSV